MSAAQGTLSLIGSPAHWALRTMAILGLGIDAVVHLRLASDYQLAVPGGIGGGNVFRIEAVAALLAAVFLLVRASRTAYLVAFIVALSALAAVVLYRYVDVAQVGPLPAMYEPVWFFEKNLSAVAEAVAAAAAGVGFLLSSRSRVLDASA